LRLEACDRMLETRLLLETDLLRLLEPLLGSGTCKTSRLLGNEATTEPPGLETTLLTIPPL